MATCLVPGAGRVRVHSFDGALNSLILAALPIQCEFRSNGPFLTRLTSARRLLRPRIARCERSATAVSELGTCPFTNAEERQLQGGNRRCASRFRGNLATHQRTVCASPKPWLAGPRKPGRQDCCNRCLPELFQESPCNFTFLCWVVPTDEPYSRCNAHCPMFFEHQGQ